ncbi:MAG: hypothetical protein U0168_15600 [Nannocystaceae bacterium]
MRPLSLCLALVALSCSSSDAAPAAPKGLVPTYAAIAAALAADDASGVPGLASELQREAKALSDKPGLGKVTSAAAGLSADLTATRRAFKNVSDGMIEYMRADASTQAGFELVHCPMAFEDKGALWVQASGKIANPYYGASMLRCGSKLAWDATLPSTATVE